MIINFSSANGNGQEGFGVRASGCVCMCVWVCELGCAVHVYQQAGNPWLVYIRTLNSYMLPESVVCGRW